MKTSLDLKRNTPTSQNSFKNTLDLEDLRVFELKYAPSHLFEKMGGKASTLAKLLKLAFPVPPGVSVLTSNLNQEHWDFIREWAHVENIYPVAVRSSAQGEDGQEVSYAGQFKTFLNISNEAEMIQAVQNCFASIELASNQSYAAHFNRTPIPMRVLIQKMINPLFSGVYFSHDPRNQNPGWMIEVVEGLGEKLVSAQVTPQRYFQNQAITSPQNTNWKNNFIGMISEWAQKTEKALGYQIDMEWAIDQNHQFWILQVRPITTQQTDLNSKDILNVELKRLLSNFESSTLWDGHSFAELSGVASELTYDIWAEAFKPGFAFDQALMLLGYTGIPAQMKSASSNSSLLDQIFGRSYLNLKKMEPIYFGEAPYKIIPEPRPHLEFDLKKLSPKLILKAPFGILQMLKVAWTIQTQRADLALKAQENLHDGHYNKQSAFEIYAACLKRNPQEQLPYLQQTIHNFTTKYLLGSFLITLLIESTVQGLIALLTKDLGSTKTALEELQHFLGENLKTIASEMSEGLVEAHHSTQTWNAFLSRFGHRGLGELELSHARWIERDDSVHNRKSNLNKKKDYVTFEDRINLISKKISPLRKSIFLQEVQELQKLLKIREDIKMHIMKPYADIRWSLLEIAKKYSALLNKPDDIFSLNLTELVELESTQNISNSKNWKKIIQNRQAQAKIFKSIEIPMIFSATQLEDVLTPKPNSSSQLLGVSLSPGLAYGVVHKVEHPELENLENWPDNTILVAEATDPGWTPLFEKSKAIIVSRGGILSHCAIVAREMGLPAVGEVYGTMSLLKEGEYVWVDGINGTIKRTC